MSQEEPWELYYWPTIPGRGEIIRLILEDRGVPYIDIGRKQGGKAILDLLESPKDNSPFLPVRAPPAIKRGNLILFQSTNIALFLSKKYGLCPEGDLEYDANALALTIADLFDEAHNVHHPVSTSLYYEDQIEEAKKAAKSFIQTRLPKFLAYFEKVLKLNTHSNKQYCVGSGCSYVDLFLFQALCGLEYAFPYNYELTLNNYPLVKELKLRIYERPTLQNYLHSDRRLNDNEHGIFRYYEELDINYSE